MHLDEKPLQCQAEHNQTGEPCKEVDWLAGHLCCYSYPGSRRSMIEDGKTLKEVGKSQE